MFSLSRCTLDARDSRPRATLAARSICKFVFMYADDSISEVVLAASLFLRLSASPLLSVPFLCVQVITPMLADNGAVRGPDYTCLALRIPSAGAGTLWFALHSQRYLCADKHCLSIALTMLLLLLSLLLFFF